MSPTSPRPSAAQENLVRQAGRALARHGLVHAYGHCSMRLDQGHFLVSPAKPLGLVGDEDSCSVVPLEGPLPDGVLGEVRIHREIYRRRPEVGGVVRSMPPRVMTLGTARITPKPRHGFGSYFAPQPPLWDDPQLLRDDVQAAALAEQMAAARAIVMRGNGAVTAGGSLEEAVVLTWYLEDAARVEFEARAAGIAEGGVILGEAEVAQRATWSGAILDRMWAYLTTPQR
ncbi:HCOMODA/2-hydroxy-3-carboxy-muconic semialdehyde decarboxylase [Bosea lupini]|uniref:HCOMODA/2-hydroxy-3-carboxy-muconic semialdehyde decarboxylase n=1 Tax=Bosea lupini TaxID=1036779 RepID=A0A1H7XJF4_9HYPH|nr:class II aldolase/adducin family protein [Bosea lupini]SEM33891.1 HCOMODA/2-hydroxy-3-carboxy-muconic semialdehyde decarboxylase [Bosea lupini]